MVRIAVIGVGRIGSMHAELLARRVARRRAGVRRAMRRTEIARAVGAELGVPAIGGRGRARRATPTRSRSARAPTRTPT